MKLIKKLFIKNYQDTKNETVMLRYGFVASIFGIVTNSILFLSKIIVGVFSGSISVISDAINNLSDVGSSSMLLFGFKFSSKPADRKHPYGHARIEQIMGLIISVIVLMIGFLLAKNSIEKVIFNQEVNVKISTFIVLAIAVLIKFFQMLMYMDFSKAIQSSSLKASAVDSRNDCIVTSMTIIALLLIKFVKVPFSIDGIFGIVISIFVIINSLKLVKETASVLLGESPDVKFVKELEKEILSYEDVLGVHDFNLHSYGVNKYFATIHAEMDGNKNLLKAHNIIDKIERDFMKKHNIVLSIHLDPVQISNKQVQKQKEKILKILKQIDERIYLHDFRIIFKKDENEIMFDAQVPFSLNITQDEIEKRLNEEYKIYKKRYIFTINIDKI